MPLSPDELIAYLDTLGIHSTTIEHPALHTVEESRSVHSGSPGAHVKNLFVKDKKSRLFVITALQDAPLDLKAMHGAIGGQGRVSFASAELLWELWGVRPGAVTPFGAINDQEGRVTQVLDHRLLAHELVNCHPLVNTRTTTIKTVDLLVFLKAVRHEPLIAQLPLQI